MSEEIQVVQDAFRLTPPRRIQLRSMGDALGSTVDVEVHFSIRDEQKPGARLVEVANALAANVDGVAALVTQVRTEFAAGHITVSACVPMNKTAEQVQRELLALLPV